MPFYYKKIDEEKKEKEFLPDKNNVLPRSPKWKICKPLEINRKPMEIREELYNEKVNKLRESWESRRIKFIDDVSLSYFKLHNGDKGGYRYYKVSYFLFSKLENLNNMCRQRQRILIGHPALRAISRLRVQMKKVKKLKKTRRMVPQKFIMLIGIK